MYWDFRGPDALEIAKHYNVHLEEFAKSNDLEGYSSGVDEVSAMYAIVHFVVPGEMKESILNRLRPHRVEP